jgi:3-phenylpropionate/trans-cinnamate dioxygenase ferredoxin subunit
MRRFWARGRGRPAAAAWRPAAGTDTDWIDVAGLGDLRRGRLVVEVADVSVLLVRVGATVVAIEDECPHLAQSLSDGWVSGRMIECPGHGYRWDLLTGRPARCPPGRSRRPLGRLAVQVTGDRILLARPGAQLPGGLASEI